MSVTDIEALLSTLYVIVPLVAVGCGLAWWGERGIGE